MVRTSQKMRSLEETEESKYQMNYIYLQEAAVFKPASHIYYNNILILLSKYTCKEVSNSLFTFLMNNLPKPMSRIKQMGHRLKTNLPHALDTKVNT